MTTTSRASALLAGLLLTLALGLGACSSAGSDSASSDAAGTSEPAAGVDAPDAARDGAAGEAADGGSSALVGDADPVARVPVQERAVVSVGTVSLSSEDVQDSRNRVQQVVDARRGELTGEETQTDDDGEMTWSRLELRVPSEDFGETMTALERIGTLVDATRTAEDVTSQVIDTDARIRAQERSLRRIEVLLDGAGSLRDIISVEAELTRRQADLDSLKQRQAHLADQTSMSRITVHIDRQAGPTPRPDRGDEPAGFLAGLEAGWGALTAFGRGLATVVGALLPFTVVLALLGLPAWLLLRRHAGRRTPPVTEAG